MTCGTNGQWSTTATACTNSACVGAGCTGVCTPGATQCSTTTNGYDTCGTNGQWSTTATACTNSACVGGACTGSCAPGAARCVSGGSETCSTGGAWSAPATCGAYTCNAAGTACATSCTTNATCSAGTYCSSSGQCVAQTATAVCSYTSPDGSPVNTDNSSLLYVVGTMAYWFPNLEPTSGTASPAGAIQCNVSASGSSAGTVLSVSGSNGSKIVPNHWSSSGPLMRDKVSPYWLLEDIGEGGLNRQYIHWPNSGIYPDGGVPTPNNAAVTFGFGDPTSTLGLYGVTGPSLYALGSGGCSASFNDDFDAGDEAGVGASFIDGAAANGTVLLVDTTRGAVIALTGSCAKATTVMTGIGASTEHAIAITGDGSKLALANGTSTVNIYLCSTTGCGAVGSAPVLAANQGTILPFGMTFDSASPPNLYWVGSAGGLTRASTGASANTTVLDSSADRADPRDLDG